MQTQVAVTSLINKNSASIKKDFNRQMTIMSRLHVLHIAKLRKAMIIIGLSLILILATTGGILGWYFTRLENKIGNSPIPDQSWRTNLNEHLTNKQLGVIADNREGTILKSIEGKNASVVTDDLYLQNITNTSATVIVKSSSNLYEHDSTVDVSFLANSKTLTTDVKQVNFPNSVLKEDPIMLLNIVKAGNQKLEEGYVMIENINKIGEVITANLTVKKGIEKNPYWLEDKLEVYFTSSNKKILQEDLKTVNLGDILDKEPETILKKIKDLNPTINTAEIRIKEGSITNNEAVITVKENSTYYIDNNIKINIFYRVFNPNIGTPLKQTASSAELDGATTIRGLWYLEDTKNILLGANGGFFLLSDEGKVITKINGSVITNKILAMLMLKDGTILASDADGQIWHLYQDGTVMGPPVKNSFSAFSLFQKSDTEIWAGGYYGKLYELDLDGKSKSDTPIEQGLGTYVSSLTKLSNNTILAGIGSNGGGAIWQLGMNGKIIKKIKDFSGGIYTISELQDGTILATSSANVSYQLNPDGTIKEQVNGTGWENSAMSLLQLPNGNIFIGTINGDVWQLRNK